MTFDALFTPDTIHAKKTMQKSLLHPLEKRRGAILSNRWAAESAKPSRRDELQPEVRHYHGYCNSNNNNNHHSSSTIHYDYHDDDDEDDTEVSELPCSRRMGIYLTEDDCPKFFATRRSAVFGIPSEKQY